MELSSRAVLIVMAIITVTKANSPNNNNNNNNQLMKHPLQHKWVMYFCKQDRTLKKAWEECLKPVASFDNVEDFWALYNHIKPPSMLPPGSDYYLFKEHIAPMWEAEHNRGGGRWLIKVQ